MVKADGCVAIHADGGAYKPLNWMNAPNTLVDDGDAWVVTNPKGETLTITLHEVLSATRRTSSAIDPGLQKDGVEAHLQELLAASPHAIEDGLTLVRREYPTAIGPIDLVCRDADGQRRRRSRSSGAARSTASSSSPATSSACTSTRRSATSAACSSPSRSSPRRGCWPSHAASAGSRSTTTSCAACRPTTSDCSEPDRPTGSGRSSRSCRTERLPSPPCRRRCAASWPTAKGEPVTVETIVVPDPGPGEALVAVQACGVCHTDLHYREGGDQRRLPVPARPRGRGHRRGGRRRTSPSVAPGDFVVLNWRAVCGECRACRRGRPWYCFATHNATQKMTLADGTELVARARHRRVRREDARRRGPGAPRSTRRRGPSRGRAARLRRDGRPRRGDATPARSAGATRVAVFGCGGVGDAAIAGARLAGRAHDHRRRPRRPQARVGQGLRRHPHRRRVEGRSGRGDPARSPTATAPTCASRRSATRRCCEQAFYARDLAGTVVQVGVPDPTMTHRAADDRVLRPRRRAEAVVVRRLPAEPRLPDAHRPLPAGPARPRPLRVARRSRSTRSRRRSTRWSAARCCARVVVL